MKKCAIKYGLALIGLTVLSVPVFGTTYVVNPEGTGDFPNIQAAINATVDGDTVQLTDGVFTGEGNKNISYLGKAITVCSQSGNPDACIIDPEGVIGQKNIGFDFHSQETSNAVLRDLTIRNGVAGAS